jgi:hypothetical protein
MLLIEAFAELGRVAREYADNFAESITDPDILSDIEGIIQAKYTDWDSDCRITSLTLDGDTFNGEFTDRVNLRVVKRYGFTATPVRLSFKLVNPSVVESFTEVDFVAGKKKSCPKGTPCGGSCISKTKTCVSELSPEQQKAHKAALRKAGTVDTSLAKKRREMKEAKRNDRLGITNMEKTLERGKRMTDDMKVVGKRLEKGFKELEKKKKEAKVTSLDSKRKKGGDNAGKEPSGTKKDNVTSLQSKRASKSVKERLGKDDVEGAINQVIKDADDAKKIAKEAVTGLDKAQKRLEKVADDALKKYPVLSGEETTKGKNPNLGSKERNLKNGKWLELQTHNPDIPDSARYLLNAMGKGMARPFPLGDSRTRQSAWHEWARNALGEAGIDYDRNGKMPAPSGGGKRSKGK